MAIDPSPPLLVRLLRPYPDLATLGGASELCLRLTEGDGSPGIEAHLAGTGADRVALLGEGTVLVEGRLDRLLAGVQSLPADLARSATVRALRDTLVHLQGPAPSLRVGDQVWEFGKRTYVLGIVNVTPDSFSGDGVGSWPEAAVEQARRLVAEGADALDIGGESTRPGHDKVELEEEIRRVLPALELIASELSIPIFVDTSKPAVARAALAAGAVGVNDVWGLRGDPEMAQVVSEARAAVICMHNQIGHQYSDLLSDVLAQLQGSLGLAEAAGVAREQVVLDPGIGFGKMPSQNYEVLRRLIELRALGCPILVGTSRKSLIGWLLDERPVDGRLLGTAATVAWSVAAGADVVRVHDVAQMRDVTRVMDMVARGSRAESPWPPLP